MFRWRGDVIPLRWDGPFTLRPKFILVKATTIVLIVITALAGNVNSSAEYSEVGTPKCDPPGRFRAGEKLDVAASKKNGAIVDTNGFSFIRTDQLADCANWCCKLPAGMRNDVTP